ncbi:glucose-1-phosphate cytidylyltransferase [Enterocloster lavalensis]|uniref:glucose-1-phosphate cytidylyltransferase n=1 Tax=Enterocloster lavalensis TaxID=460384 RepID=UPI001D07BEB5|nr:glucose-1-phosphate cytidylyltransferase [Enterocloster lavalensis]MCB6345822.1 glucose-1-phosphate cytidylyltransferase [Enterocloster lavalensis]
MKVVILAGGFGTRISEESQFKPKPMVEIGGKPILWHIMKSYSHYGYNDFVICAGYKQDVIKQYFFDYYLHNSDVTFDLQTNQMKVHSNHSEPWTVSVIDTGLQTMTGGRIKRIRDYVNQEPFMLTYGDGVSDVDLRSLEKFHKENGKMVTMSSYNVGQQFGVLDSREDGLITGFREKSKDDGNLINIGYMVCNPDVFDYIDGDNTVFEKEPLQNLAKDEQLIGCHHNGFWKCMDTVRDRTQLEEMWNSGKAPWKVWCD